MSNELIVYNYLDNLKIKYHVTEHEPLYTMEDAGNIKIEGINPKNLVLKDKKTGLYYLYILSAQGRFDGKIFKKETGSSSKISFVGQEKLPEILGVTSGACSPFTLINPKAGEVICVISKEIADLEDDQLINFHPNVNTKTVTLTVKDFKEYLKSLTNKIIIEKY